MGLVLLSVADKVTAALGGRTGGEFKAWVRDDIGSLPVKDPELPKVIDSLDTPIATTNYDSLLEKVLSKSATTWMNPNEGQLILQRKSSNILHLHGHWAEPESIVLGDQSYGVYFALEQFASYAYYSLSMSPADTKGIRDFLVNQLMSRVSVQGGMSRRDQMARIAQTLERNRELSRRMKLSELDPPEDE